MSLFPARCQSVGQRVEYLSRQLLPTGKFDEYVAGMRALLHPGIRYVDPVHEYHERDSVLSMLRKFVPRVCNDRYDFELISDSPEHVVWRWTIAIRIRFTPLRFTIHGLVHAKIENGQILYQREYFDPMESIGVIPFVGRFYKLVLRFG